MRVPGKELISNVVRFPPAMHMAVSGTVPQPPRIRGGAKFASGQKGKGAGGGGIEAPNTLQSRSVVRVIDLLGEGPIGGLLNGAKSIYFNGVPLMNQQGKYNFKGITWEMRFGTPTQTPIPGFPSTEDTITIGVQVKANNGPYIFSASDPYQQLTRMAVTVSVPAMYVVDTNNGNTNPSSASLVIAVSPGSGGQPVNYVTVVTDTISGKCVSTYQRTYTFVLPKMLVGQDTWYVKVQRTSGDSTTNNVQNSTYLDAVDLITDYSIQYCDSAMCALTFDAELFGSALPTRTYDIQGLIIQVPYNYTPATYDASGNVLTYGSYVTSGAGTSGGTWDGASWKPAICDNPAWELWDLFKSVRYGCALPTQALEATKWDLYIVGQYADGQIPSGFLNNDGSINYMPRYRCNVCIANRDDAYNIIQAFLSVFRGMAYWGGGTVRITADMPTAVTKLVTKADVLDGKFIYQGTALRTRHTLAVVGFTDPAIQWQPNSEIVQSKTAIVTTNFAQNMASLVAFGAISRGQAHLFGAWLLDSEQNNTETVTYRAALDALPSQTGMETEQTFDVYGNITGGVPIDPRVGAGAYDGWAGNYWPALTHLSTMPGNVVEIQDPAYMKVRWGGRLGAAATTDGTHTFLQLDAPVASSPATFVQTLPTTVTVGLYVRDFTGQVYVGVAGSPNTWQTTQLWGPPITTSDTDFITGGAITYLIDVEIPGHGIAGNQAVTAIVLSGGVMTLTIAPTIKDPLDGTTPILPAGGSQWILKSQQTVSGITSGDKGPRLFRVVSVTEPQKGVLEVTALNHDPTKYARVELGLNLQDSQYYSFGTNPYTDAIGSPAAVAATDYFVGEGSTTVLRTTVSWLASEDPRVLSYNLEAVGDNGYDTTFRALSGNSFDIDNLALGNYVFGVQGVTGDGRLSPWALSPKLAITGNPPTPQTVTVSAFGGTRQILLRWTDALVPNLAYYVVQRTSNTIVMGVDTPLAGGWVQVAQVTATTWTDTDSAFLLPLTSAWYRVAAVSTTGVQAAWSNNIEGQTNALLVQDLPLAIQGTAAFAQSLLLAAPVLVSSLPSSGPLCVPNQFVVDTSANAPYPAGQLYYWSAGGAAYWAPNYDTGASPTPVGTLPGTVTVGQYLLLTTTQQQYRGTAAVAAGWVPTIAVIGADGKITASAIEAGAVSAQEIAANAIWADHLAVNFALFNYEQVGQLTVGNLNFVNDAVTSYAEAANSSTGGTGNNVWNTDLVPLSVTVPASQDGSTLTRNGFVMIDLRMSCSPLSAFTTYGFRLYQNGTLIFNRTGLAQYVDFVHVAVPITVSSATPSVFRLDWQGNATTPSALNLGFAQLVFLGRVA